MSFLKWAGGKRKLVPLIDSIIKEYDGRRFIEPFVGGGSVFSAISQLYEQTIINDINTNLIAVYRYLQVNPDEFIHELQSLFIPENNCLEAYTRLKSEYNHLNDGIWRKALLFVYLNKHGFNGMYRVNSRGQYNIPFGRYKSIGFPKNIEAFASKLLNVEIYNQDYLSIMDMANRGDIVYCDPPYLPLSKTANFNQYEKNGFNIAEQEKLADMANRLADRGAVVLISNHDTPVARQLYQRARIIELNVQRNIGATRETRIKVPELIAVFAYS